jgi:hypothetical protein
MPPRAGNRDFAALSKIVPSYKYPLAEEKKDVLGFSDPTVMDAGR